ncbi:MAG: M15 family metallopeptidase [bacterium]|nr:M15 family metallopeptidase [bacterium]
MARLDTTGLHDDMIPLVEDFHTRCGRAGLDLLVYCTLRTGSQQARIWRKGRATSDIDGEIMRAREYQGRILSGAVEPKSRDIALARAAEKGIPDLAMFAPAETDAISVARFLNWSLGCILTVGPQKGATIRTNAMPGRSSHQYGVAVDAIVLDDGKALWDEPDVIQEMGEHGEAAGLEWAGRWTTFRERVHFQLPEWQARMREQIPAGAPR